MARNYKSIEYSSGQFESNTYYKSQTFTNESEGINSIQYRSESLNFNESEGPFSYTTSGSHYNFLYNFLFETSSFHNYGGLHKNKFYSSGSVIYIPQQYYGEQIKPETFTLTDKSTSGIIVIKDDGEGNLYSTNAQFSQSTNHASHSDNYVGNIHYESGIVMITETGSWSGSVGGNGDDDINYTDVGTGAFNVEFNSTQTLHTNEIVCNIRANEFTATSNATIWSSSYAKHGLSSEISSSIEHWSPYATSIAFYDGVPDVFRRNSIYTLTIPRTDMGNVNVTQTMMEKGNGVKVIWEGPTTEINTKNIPYGIHRINYYGETGTEIDYRYPKFWYYDEPSYEWVRGTHISGDLHIPFKLKYGHAYWFYNYSNHIIEWQVEHAGVTGVPVMVAHFPRPVKIDRLSDLNIIIRYDT